MPHQNPVATNPKLIVERKRAQGRAVLAGIASAAGGVGAAEIVAALIAPRASPLFAAGSLVIDLAPAWLKTLVIDLFGTADKVVIIVCVALLVTCLAGVAGLLERTRSPWGLVVIGVVGALGLFAAVTRADSTIMSAFPSAVAVFVGILLLKILTKQSAAVSSAAGARSEGIARRTFLITSGLTAGVGILTAVAGRVATTGAQAVDAARRMFTLPQAAVVAPPIPAGAALDVSGITPLVTPNSDFYRIDTALLVPSLDPATWSLTITGMVEREVTITFDELLALPLEESYATLACVSNEVGGGLIGNALWLGYPIRHLLAEAKPTAGADMVLSRSSDGFTAGTPLEALTDDRNAILAVAMNGTPLPAEHGFPVRMVVPGLFGYVSATKWVTEMKVTSFVEDVAYWTQHGWTALGPVKLSSRIDTPRPQSTVPSGEVTIAGVAWSQHLGISGVEVQVDDGPWTEAELAQAISVDTWLQWSHTWNAAPGRHQIAVRATDANGMVQTADLAPVAPDGATGRHTILVNVE